MEAAADAVWHDRIEAFWRDADGDDPDAVIAGMRELIAERPEGDAEALFEQASAFDFIGHEAEAVPLYQRALAGELPEPQRQQATVQLASSLRNIGRTDEAIALLRALDAPELGAAPQAFLALAQYSAGDPVAALATALEALAESVPMYGRAIRAYAAELASRAV